MQLGEEARTTPNHIDLRLKMMLKVEKEEVVVGAKILVRKEPSRSLLPRARESKWRKLLAQKV